MTLDSLPPYCLALLQAKSASHLTFSELAKALDKPEVWTTALFFGQAKCDDATAEKLVEVLGGGAAISENKTDTGVSVSAERVVSGLTGKGLGVEGMVVRGATWDWPPKDPVLYRLYEVLVVYGWSYKALIAEKFGDGIMSAIGFRTTVEKKSDPLGDRVVITMDGKWLPYSSTDQWDMSLTK